MARALFWLSTALIAYTHVGYPLVLWLLARQREAGRTPRAAEGPAGDPAPESSGPLPAVSLIVAAHDEEAVIGARVENARALDYPPDRLEVIVASDGSSDATAGRARAAGADVVLELPRGGKVAAQDAAAERARGELLAFSDANSLWEPDALRRLVAPFASERVGYVCGEVRFRRPPTSGNPNQEGLYWRYENALRSLESRLAGVTAGNGAIYAVRRSAYLHLDPRTSHDLSFPSALVRRGWRALVEPSAHASEAMAPTVEGEFRRKRRMMRHAWPTVLGPGLLPLRGYPPLYALEVVSHRGLRYATPALHLAALAASVAMAVRRGGIYTAVLTAQLAMLVAAALAPVLPARPLLLVRYYLLVTAAVAGGLWDHLREGTPATWEREEGAR
jgi:cellulose synthase/poly-beta-1,6-N-acetylglucosamine synthase-like glycosyltransferase